MRYKVGDVVLVKLCVVNASNKGELGLSLPGTEYPVWYFHKKEILSLVSRKPKKEKDVVYVGGAFVDHPEEAKGAFQPEKWSKLDMGEPFYPDAIAGGWMFDSFPNTYRDVKLLLKDGSQITGWFTDNEWWRFGDRNCNRIGITAHVAAWKELDK